MLPPGLGYGARFFVIWKSSVRTPVYPGIVKLNPITGKKPPDAFLGVSSELGLRLMRSFGHDLNVWIDHMAL